MKTTVQLLLPGQKCCAKREPDLDAEDAEVKSVNKESGTCVLRFDDGFQRQRVPAHEVAIRDEQYDLEVLPRLPPLPTDPTQGDEKYAFAGKFKEVGNDCFKQGKHAWAIRTYIGGLQMLQSKCFADPTEVRSDERARALCVAMLSNSALCSLKLDAIYTWDLDDSRSAGSTLMGLARAHLIPKDQCSAP